MNNVTKDEKLSELIECAVARLRVLPPPVGMTDAAAISAYYDIFKSPAHWKAGVRTPQETTVPNGKLASSFKRARAPMVFA